MNFVTLLIQATALMAALIILRPLLKRVLSPRALCALWAIPAARMLFPLELKSSLSIMAPAESVSAAVGETVSRPTGIEAPTWLGSGLGLENNNFHSAMPSPSPNGSATASFGFAIGDILIAIWLVGALATAGLIIYQNVKFARSARRHGEYMGKGCGLPTYVLGALPTPCLAGVFKPRIYINRQALSSDDVLEMTLRHEMTHYKRLDHIWGAVRGLILVLYWFHPLVWYCSELFRSDCETACDAAATSGMNEEEKQSYGMALITLASRVPRGSTGRLVCLSTMNGGKKLLRERITRLAKGRSFRCAAAIAIAVAAVLCFTMCTTPSDEQQVPTPPSPTPGFRGEEPLSPAEPVPPEGVEKFSHDEPFSGAEGSLGDLAYYLELAAASEFEDMDAEVYQSIMDEYGTLLNGSKFISRSSTDGKYSYIACLYQVQAAPVLNGMYSVEISRGNEDAVQVLYTEEQREWVEHSLTEANLPSDVYILHNSRIYYHPDSNLILIEPVSTEISLQNIYSRYIGEQRAYIFDAIERGIALARPQGPYLEVYLISEKWGEISERIPLTKEEADAILNEELTEIIPGFGFSASLYHDGTSELYNENRGIPQSVLDLAVEKCDYRFGDPGMINAPITEAKLECSWLNEPLYADEADLARLERILKNAQFGYVGACGYGAKLTVRMGQEMVTMFKGTDGCDTIVFGSYSGYFLGDAENEEFWEIFGMDVERRIPKAPEISITGSSGTQIMSTEDAQALYDVLISGTWSGINSACGPGYTIVINGDEIQYHDECGTFNGDRGSLSLTEEQMQTINEILLKYPRWDF